MGTAADTPATSAAAATTEQAKAAYQQAGNSQKASEMDTLLASIAADTAIAAGLPQ